MTYSLRDFFRLIASAAAEGDPDEALADVGIDTWEEDPSPITAEERGGMIDPRTGAQIRLFTFEASYAPPEALPQGWPFVVALESAYAEATLDLESMRFLAWLDPTNIAVVADDVRKQLIEDGWAELQLPAKLHQNAVQPRPIAWFQRDAQDRVLCHGSYGETSAVVLIEASPSQVWPDREQLEW